MPPQSHNWENFQLNRKGYSAKCSKCTLIALWPEDLDKQGQCPGHEPEDGCTHVHSDGQTSAVVIIGTAERCTRCGHEWVSDRTPSSYTRISLASGMSVRVPVYDGQGMAGVVGMQNANMSNERLQAAANAFGNAQAGSQGMTLSQVQGQGNSTSPYTMYLPNQANQEPEEPRIVTAALADVNAYWKVNYSPAEWQIIDPSGAIRLSGVPYPGPSAFSSPPALWRAAKRWIWRLVLKVRHRFRPKPSVSSMYPNIPVVKLPTGRRRKKCLSQA